MGKAEGRRAPPLDQSSRRRGPAQEGQGTSLVPRDREEGPTSPHLELGKLMQSWAGRNQKKKLAAMESYDGGMEWGGNLYPCEGKGGKIGEALGNLENGTAPPALILANL